jgi:hypothetical protein
MECRVFFEGLPTERPDLKLRAKLIDDQFPEGACETQSVSTTSNGIVEGQEYAHRFVFSPVHLDGEMIKAAFFSDCQYAGLSCQRSSSDSIDPSIHERGQRMVNEYNENRSEQDDERTYLGVVTARCSDIRNLVPLKNEASEQPQSAWDRPMMAVYGTGKTGDELHIDVFQLFSGRKKADLKQARRDLALVFTRTAKS